MGFVLIYDLPGRLATERKQLNLKLRKADARKAQHSFWRHGDIKTIISLGIWIRKIGGTAKILEERSLFQA